jgi:hypothetical protein
VGDRYFGKYSGVVKDNRDDTDQGIVTVTVPTIFPADEIVAARPALPYGVFFVPEVDTGVWVEFEGGDSEFPLWTGVQHTQATWAPEAAVSPPTARAVRTPSGHLLVFDDTSGSESVLLTDGVHSHLLRFDADGVTVTDGTNGHEVVLSSSGITVTDGVNQHSVVLDSSGVGLVHGGGSTRVALAPASLTLSSGASSIELAASGVTITGPQVKLGGAGAALGVMRLTDQGIGNLGAPVPLMPPGSLVVKTM